ncbi:Acetyl esterase/lipase [Cnuella takakiae]|uniref:Acetyl esterase/lipase n=1 Tax=Cnuella takakiae TaxID=1302690 RepID=A0A1M5A3Z1_9BACT|nr:esterase [Cnuella takakiae]SHF24646.1 Acetyl esterase/lipase [Cnuella takakiae]
MLKTVVITCFLASSFYCQGQSTTGITGIPDTSYSNYSAFIQTRKTHPDIRVPNVPSTKKVREQKDLVYCNREGRALKLDTFVPAAKGKGRTAILFVHGGGWRTGNRTQHHDLARKMALMGYVVFTPEYRLSTEALYPAAVHDIKASLRWLHAHAAEYGVDTAKIAIGGFSAGGQLAALVGSTNGNVNMEGTGCTDGSSSVGAILDLDGILAFIHPESGEGDDSKRTSAATYWFGYGKDARPEIWKEASALTHVGPHTPPTLFLNSSVDRMHAGRDDYRKVLDQYGIYSEVHQFEGAPHGFPLFQPWFEPTVQYIDEFLKKVFGK